MVPSVVTVPVADTVPDTSFWGHDPLRGHERPSSSAIRAFSSQLTASSRYRCASTSNTSLGSGESQRIFAVSLTRADTWRTRSISSFISKSSHLSEGPLLHLVSVGSAKEEILTIGSCLAHGSRK